MLNAFLCHLMEFSQLLDFKSHDVLHSISQSEKLRLGAFEYESKLIARYWEDFSGSESHAGSTPPQCPLPPAQLTSLKCS